MQLDEQLKLIVKPWGHEKIIEKTPNYTIKSIFVKKGHRLSLQSHREKDETMMLVEGAGSLYVKYEGGFDYNLDMVAMYPYRISPGVIHRLSAIHSDCLVIEISRGNDSDIIRYEDDYGR